MKKIDGAEGRILKKYLTGRIIEEQDRLYIRRLLSVGLMQKGYSFEQKKATAKTTYLGYSSI